MKEFDELINILKRLRDPENGCPWDLKQTPESLLGDLIEEAYECVDAVTNQDNENIREELGDLYLMVTFIAYIKQQNNDFTIEDVLQDINEKLIRRHPHIFSDAQAESADEVIEQWDKIKETEKGKKKKSILDTVPKNYPPLLKASKLQEKASKKGFDWNNPEQIIEKIEEELSEWKDAVKNETKERQFEEMGDLLFSVVNLARFSGIKADLALNEANQKFIKRFQFIENQMRKSNKELSSENIELMEEYWNKAKSLDISESD